MNGTTNPTPIKVLGTAQLYTASWSSSSLNVHVLTNELVHVTFTNFTTSSTGSNLSAPTFTGNITNLYTNSYSVGGVSTSLRIAEFNVQGDFTITPSISSYNWGLLELTSLEAD